MGDIAKTLGFGNPEPSAQDQYNKMPDIYGQDIVSQLLGGFNPSLPMQQAQADVNTNQQSVNQALTPAGDANDPQAIKGWQPHHRTTLGFLADALLSGLSGTSATPFAAKANSDNMQEAMQGFTQDPEETIRRIARFNPKMALELQEKYTDNARQQGNLDRQNNVFDMQKERIVYDRIAGMMGGADEKTWGSMRKLALAVGNKYGVDVTPYVPENYDPDSIKYMQQGAIKPLDQEKLKETVNYHGETIQTRERGQDIRHGDAVRGQDLSHGDRVSAETGRNARHTGPAGKPQARSLMTKYGPGIINKDGTQMLVSREGKHYLYIHTGKSNGQDNWVPSGEVEVK